jgi:hypothetical protein
MLVPFTGPPRGKKMRPWEIRDPGWGFGLLVNVVSLAYKILTANHVLIMQQINPKGLHHTTDECSIRVPQTSGRQF